MLHIEQAIKSAPTISVNVFKRSVSKFGHLFTNNRIEKKYNNKIHRVELGKHSFIYEGKEFASLSKVVKEIRKNKTGIVSPSVFFRKRES